VIELQNITKKIDDKYLYHDLSLMVPAGGRLLIKGESGSGKTTLLRMLLGFDFPDEGKVMIDGKKLGLENVWLLRRQMAYVSQEMQIGRGKAESFIREVLAFKNNRYLSYDRSKVLTLMDDFHLAKSTLDKRLEDLSGGELQRLAIIVTLLLERKIYLLDEITSALDQHLKELIVHYFCSLDDKTLVISSHDAIWHDQNFPTLNLGKNGSSS